MLLNFYECSTVFYGSRWKEDKEGLALGVSLSNQRVRGIGGVILRLIYVMGGRHLSTFQAASNSAIIMRSNCAVI